MNEVGSCVQEVKQVTTSAGRRLREDRQVHARGLTNTIKLHLDTVQAFIGVKATVGIAIDENEISNPDGALESKVHREIDGRIERVVTGCIHTGLTIEIRRRLTGGDGDGAGANPDDFGIDDIDTILAHIVITRKTFGDADFSIQRTPGGKRGTWNVNDVVSRNEIFKEVEPPVGTGRGQNRRVHADDLRKGVKVERHAIKALAHFRLAVLVGVMENQVTQGDRAEDTQVNGQVVVEFPARR